MTFLEIILTPVYIFLMYLFFKRRREKLDSTILKHYHKQAFWFKIIASLLFMVYYTYMTGGDTRTLYFLEGKNLFHLLLQDGSNWKYIFTAGKNMNEHLLTQTLNIGYLQSEANFMIIRLTAILSFLTFGQYTLIGLFFACFAFSGLWKLFMFFYERKPELHKALAISILFFPSVVFWSSGLMKDSLMIGALGWFTYSLDQFSSGKNLVRNFLILSLAAYMMITVKVYIFLAYAPLLFLFILFEKLKAIKAVLLRVFLVLVVIVVSIFSFLYAYSSFEEELGTYALENVTSSMEKLNTTLASMTAEQGAESNFNLGAQFEGTPQSLIKVAPFAIVASFFRPFIWEASKVSQLLSALESLALMLITLFLFVRLGPFRMVRFYLSDPMIFFCLTFALVFGVFIGATTVNFGTLVRYKIPCLPFYAIALALLYNKYNARQYKGKITL
ncbi:MAG TPA: hypothetical protein PLM81_00620 [Ginsengibacter sp.]|nr:hypothetical protein [Ginsengibacter sp.]HRP43164.1 hypothetical protein [Ginsengibacter sp.]